MLKSAVFLIFLIIFSACESYNNVKASIEGDIVDNAAWYSDMNDEVIDINITVPVPNDYNCSPHTDPLSPERPCTLEDIYFDINASDNYEPELHVVFNAKDYNYSSVENAVLKQKGKTTRHAKLKSYRVKLDKNVPLIFNERTLQMNKHPNDNSRVRNKMSFEFFQDIPNFTSLKTRFCRLYINGDDYGLFTHIESCDKYFLKNRGWNEDDYLYKAQNFSFRLEDALKLDKKGNPIDKKAFEAVIEPQTGKDYSKLIEMLNAINKKMSDAEFEKVFNKYFNRNNYITWMAVNIVVANKDTVSQNFFLYNPLHSDTFYITPWDYDGTAIDNSDYSKWELGIGNWWDIPLHNKFLKIKKNRDDLDAMVTKIREEYITPEKIQEKLNRYRPLVEPFILREPDLTVLPYDIWEKEYNSLVKRVDINIKNYRDQFGSPMPYWQTFSYENGILTLKWDESIDLEGDEVVYDVQCAYSPDMNASVIIDKKALSVKNGDLNITSWGEVSYSKKIDLQDGDILYMKVISKEKNNPAHYQVAFNKEVIVGGVEFFGVLELVIGK